MDQSQEFLKTWESIVQDIENGDSAATYKGNSPSINSSMYSNLPIFSVNDQTILDNEEKAVAREATILNTVSPTEETFIEQENNASTTSLAAPGSNYQIQEKIAHGGMGIIYKGQQNSLQRDIAIKKILAENPNQTVRDKFIAEALITAYLDHPNIVPVHELGSNEQGEIMLTMKLVGGTSWKDLLHPGNEKQKKRAENYDLEKHIRILLNVCNALSFSHSKGIVHNDLKPDNVMVGEFGEVLVMDWGLAVDTGKPGENISRTMHKSEIKNPMGTPCYMAPELAQGDGDNIGPWTDVYLLGVILFEIATGNPPHRRKNVWQSILAASSGELPEFPGNFPRELKSICKKAMIKECSQRYQTIQELEEALQQFLHHQESVIISEKAREVLKNASNQLQQIQLNRSIVFSCNPYCGYSQALFGFNQALDIWKNNEDALLGIRDTLLGYARMGYYREDFTLSDSLASDLENMVRNALDQKNLTEKTRTDLEATFAEVDSLKMEIAKSQRETLVPMPASAAGLFYFVILLCGVVLGLFLANKLQ